MRRDDVSELAAASGAGTHAMTGGGARGLRIVHCLRSPVGGLFRHVRDLAEMQAQAGHEVGIICDAATGGPVQETALRDLAPSLALGIHRFSMQREIALSDIALTLRLVGVVRALNPDILHAHGAKGGAYARTVGTLLRASGKRVARIYTPHGGSLHYDARSMKGRLFLTIERALAAITDAFVFVSRYEADTFAAKVGPVRKPETIALNGLRPEEFETITVPPDARDFLFIGELRELKGPDVFLNALALIRDRTGPAPTAVMVGDGPDKARARSLTAELGLEDAVTFLGPMAARAAFRLARAVVMPSRNESLPYVALEAIAAGMPIVATRVGGVPEIFGAEAGALVAPGDVAALADAMRAGMSAPDEARRRAERLRSGVRQRFTVEAMSAAVAGIYERALAG